MKVKFHNLMEVLRGFLWGAVICAVLWCLFGCASTRYVEVPKIQEKYIVRTDSVLSHDSVYLHDSIMCLVRGDSVFTDRWHTKYIERLKYINHTDTVCQRDSITVPVEVIKTKTKTDYTGWFVALLMALGIGFYIKRKLL